MDPTELIAPGGGGLQSIFIAVSYRLSVFGFLASKELAEEAAVTGEHAFGNYGLWDQRAALEWIYEHANFFGGNPDEITLSGRSAGAYSVHAHASHDFLLHTNKPALYKRLVMQVFLGGSMCATFNVSDLQVLQCNPFRSQDR